MRERERVTERERKKEQREKEREGEREKEWLFTIKRVIIKDIANGTYCYNIRYTTKKRDGGGEMFGPK